MKGVVDSEDLPLSITREKMQDTKLLRKINEALTRRIIRFLDEMARKDRAGYNKYFKEFGSFLKEGVCTDFSSRQAIAKLLRFQVIFVVVFTKLPILFVLVIDRSFLFLVLTKLPVQQAGRHRSDVTGRVH